jgi:NAD+ synthase
MSSSQENPNPRIEKMLELDAAQETKRLVDSLVELVYQRFRRQGTILGISGGIDSSVCLALCVRAFGAERVMGILLPERESSPESADLAHLLAQQYNVQTCTEDITAALDGLGCYRRRDEAIRRVFPDYQPNWKVRIVLPGDLLDQGSLNIFSLVVNAPDGQEQRKRLSLRDYAQIVAASNFKQRVRTNLLYYHAELRNYAVIGTPNKNEHDLGFFVKWGDGGYDVAPIRHLFKSQVYQLARYLDVPRSIQDRTPSTDTYPGGGSQEEFFFRIPHHLLDTIWFGYEKGIPSLDIAGQLGLSPEQVEYVIADIQRKQRTTAYLRTQPLGA